MTATPFECLVSFRIDCETCKFSTMREYQAISSSVYKVITGLCQTHRFDVKIDQSLELLDGIYLSQEHIPNKEEKYKAKFTIFLGNSVFEKSCAENYLDDIKESFEKKLSSISSLQTAMVYPCIAPATTQDVQNFTKKGSSFFTKGYKIEDLSQSEISHAISCMDSAVEKLTSEMEYIKELFLRNIKTPKKV